MPANADGFILGALTRFSSSGGPLPPTFCKGSLNKSAPDKTLTREWILRMLGTSAHQFLKNHEIKTCS
jgi:hypothetical protein